MRPYTDSEIRVMLLPFDPDAECSRCGHGKTKVAYEKDTSHYGCPLGKSLETSWGPEHLTVRCQRCGFVWERRCTNVEDQPTVVSGSASSLKAEDTSTDGIWPDT